MAALQEIRAKVRTVQNMQRITHAMATVAQSKMRKVRERLYAARPYGEKVRMIATHLCQAHPEYRSPFLVRREPIKQVGLILVTADKGMCGSLNANITRLATTHLHEWAANDVSTRVCAIGRKGLAAMRRAGANVASHAAGLGDTPSMDRLAQPVQEMLDAYAGGAIDALYLCYTRFLTSVAHKAVMEPLLPLGGDRLGSLSMPWDYLYEPDAKTIVNELLRSYVTALIYQAVAESMASEQSARMVAMKSATDNAGRMLDDLRLMYNKTRQAAITKEISEIVGGAAAV